MSSASSPVKDMLEQFVAGRAKPDRVIEAVVAAYYRETGGGKREYLRPLVEVIERAAPGVVELAGKDGGAGFAIRLAERPFPKQYEADLRSAAAAVLREAWPEAGERVGRRGFLARMLQAVRRVFGGSPADTK